MPDHDTLQIARLLHRTYWRGSGAELPSGPTPPFDNDSKNWLDVATAVIAMLDLNKMEENDAGLIIANDVMGRCYMENDNAGVRAGQKIYAAIRKRMVAPRETV